MQRRRGWRASQYQSFCILLLISTAVNCLNTQITLTGMSTTAMPSMPVLAVRAASIAHPTGDPNFSVMQGFPEPFNSQESDPFLMCDVFGPTPSKGIQTDPDKFDVAWHPHRGMDILTYITEGTGRHADSLGNRETFSSPGMQWISVGSGIEHAEGGGTPVGQNLQGFQIWVNVPSERKMDDPRYGTEPPENIPTLSIPSVTDGGEAIVARVLAGELQGNKGPFRTVQDVQIIDYSLPAGAEMVHTVPEHMDNCLVYVFKGSAVINDQTVDTHHIVRLDAQSGQPRGFTIRASEHGARLLVFAGKRLNQPIAWHGPFVMTTQAEIQQTLREYKEGTFLKKRAAWDYKRIATKPASKK